MADLRKASESDHYSAPLARMILSSAATMEAKAATWDYMSLADLGRSDFSSSYAFTVSFDLNRPSGWEDAAIESLTDAINWYVFAEDEGLILFVCDDDGAFRPAAPGDADYDYVTRLRRDGALYGLRLTVPPSWAERLYVNFCNLEVHRLMWNDHRHFPDREFEAKRMKAEAVRRETARRTQPASALRADPVPLLVDEPNSGAAANARWPWGTHETVYLRQLAAAAQRFWVDNYNPDDRSTAPRNEDIVKWLVERGVPERPAQLMATLLRADGLPTGPRK